MGCSAALTILNVPTSSSLIKPNKLVENISSQHFEKKVQIGKGSFGKVYLIKSKETNKEYALKTITINKDNELEKAIKEANILRELDHPNIISFKGAFKSDQKKQLYIVTEYAEGGDLGQLLSHNYEKNIYFEEKQLLNWLIQCCFALFYLHEEEILHRDIKPSNIFLMKDNTIKLGDFGIAKDIHIFHSTKTLNVGTPLYMAPEIIEEKRYDLKVDIWSLGVTFCHLMTLNFPFDLKKKIENKCDNIIKGIKSNKITDSNGNYKEEIKNKYSKEFLDLINQMMSLNPQKRPNIEDILKKDIIIKRMDSILEENEYNPTKACKIIEEYEEKKEKENKEINEKIDENLKNKINIDEPPDENESFDNNNNVLTQENTPAKKDTLRYNFQRQLSLIHKEKLNRRTTMNY